MATSIVALTDKQSRLKNRNVAKRSQKSCTIALLAAQRRSLGDDPTDKVTLRLFQIDQPECMSPVSPRRRPDRQGHTSVVSNRPTRVHVPCFPLPCYPCSFGVAPIGGASLVKNASVLPVIPSPLQAGHLIRTLKPAPRRSQVFPVP